MAQCPEANLPTGGDFPVSLVRNADDFLLRLRQFAGEYERTFEPLISRLRQQYTGKLEEQLVNDHLEFHARVYFVNAFLAALNWRLDQSPGNGLPNLVPEVPVRSEERRTVRFLDYLGLERDTDRPLLIVETKRPGDPLPRLRSGQPASTYSEIIARGCSGEALSGEWNNWLETSLKARARSTRVHPLDHAHIALGPFRWDTSLRRPRGIRFSPGRLAITSLGLFGPCVRRAHAPVLPEPSTGSR